MNSEKQKEQYKIGTLIMIENRGLTRAERVFW